MFACGKGLILRTGKSVYDMEKFGSLAYLEAEIMVSVYVDVFLPGDSLTHATIHNNYQLREKFWVNSE